MDRAFRALGIVAVLLVSAPDWAAAAEVKAAEEKATEEKSAEEKESRLRGLYVSGGVLAAISAFDVPTEVGQQDSWGLDARVGYQLHPHFALEVDYQWAARFELTSGGAQLDVIRTNTATANAKVPILSGPLSPYLVLGFGLMNASLKNSADQTEAAMRVGGGVQLSFGEHFGAYAELTYLKPFGTLDDLNSVPIAVGGTYRF